MHLSGKRVTPERARAIVGDVVVQCERCGKPAEIVLMEHEKKKDGWLSVMASCHGANSAVYHLGRVDRNSGPDYVESFRRFALQWSPFPATPFPPIGRAGDETIREAKRLVSERGEPVTCGSPPPIDLIHSTYEGLPKPAVHHPHPLAVRDAIVSYLLRKGHDDAAKTVAAIREGVLGSIVNIGGPTP